MMRFDRVNVATFAWGFSQEGSRMIRHWKSLVGAIALAGGGIGVVTPQPPAASPPADAGSSGRAPGAGETTAAPLSSGNLHPVATAPRPPTEKVTAGNGTLPNDQG